MTWSMPQHVDEQPMYHRTGATVWYEDSKFGIREADRGNYASIDLNLNWSRPDKNCVICVPKGVVCVGHIWNVHYATPLMHDFVDPLGKTWRGKNIHRMSTEQILRLHVKGHPAIKIDLIDYQIPRLRRHHLNGSLEPKGRYGWTRALMQHLMDLCVANQVPAIVKSAYTAPLREARAVGFPTRYTRDHRRGM